MGRRTLGRRRFLRATSNASLGALAGLLAGRSRPARAQQGRPPNILWLMTDDLRADGLSCYGQPWAKTPNLDALAQEGVRFEVAVVQSVICVPSRTSMLASRYCHTLGTMGMGKPAEGQPEAPELPPPLLDAFGRRGYHLVNIGKCHAYRQAWDINTGNPPASRAPKPKLTDRDGPAYPTVRVPNRPWIIGGTVDVHPDDSRPARYVDAALEYLENAREPWLLRVSFHEPHVPIQVPRTFMIDPDAVTLPLPTEEELAGKPRWETEYLSQYAGSLPLSRDELQIARGTYYGVTSLVDHHIGRLLDHLRESGQAESTIILFTSDHGLQMGEHGLHKKRNFYEQTVCVPLLLRFGEGLPGGRVVRRPVELQDVLPTVMELAGMPTPEGIHGRSMVRLVRGTERNWRRAVFSEIDHAQSMYDCLRKDSGRRVMVRTRRRKLIYFKDERAMGPEGALYDLDKDPGETRNLYGRREYAEVQRRLAGMVDRWDERTS